MSHYVSNLGVSIERALRQVPSAQPAQVAGYWANRDFWIDEFEHLLAVINGHERRLDRMKAAYEAYAESFGEGEFRDEFGNHKQTVRDTSDPPSRRRVAGDARGAIKALADRALDLGITDHATYDEFVARLRISNH